MTIIAWDGKTLAADKQVSSGGYAQTVTKIFKVKGSLIGFAGNAGHAQALLAWFKAGAKLADWPKPFDDKDTASLVVITPKGEIREYEGTANGHYDVVEDRITAMGSGRDYALAAMHLGQSAYQAAEIACHFDINCGKGIDSLTLKD